MIVFHVWARWVYIKSPMFKFYELMALFLIIPCMLLQWSLFKGFIFKYNFLTYTDVLSLFKLVQLKTAISTLSSNLNTDVSSGCSGNCLSQVDRENIVINKLQPAMPNIQAAIDKLRRSTSGLASMGSNPIFACSSLVAACFVLIACLKFEQHIVVASSVVVCVIVSIAYYIDTDQAQALLVPSLFKNAFCGSSKRIDHILAG